MTDAKQALEVVERLRSIAGSNMRVRHGDDRQAIKEAASLLASIAEENERLRGALKPFAVVGKLIDGPFGPALFVENDRAFSGGCAWTENGEKKTLTWGDFRAARQALTTHPAQPEGEGHE